MSLHSPAKCVADASYRDEEGSVSYKDKNDYDDDNDNNGRDNLDKMQYLLARIIDTINHLNQGIRKVGDGQEHDNCDEGDDYCDD